jgi:pimeloyl-ACP methyl ester carboxylesterase
LDREAVVIAHGLWLNGRATGVLRARLAQLGHRAQAFSYHSVHHSLSENAQRLYQATLTLDAERVHLVGHSLGGVLAVQMLHEHPDDSRFGRIVLAGSPFQGSHVGSQLSRFSVGQHILGRSVEQWLTQKRPDITDRFDVGVISGTRGIGLGRLIPGLPAPNDGTIAVEETKVPGMTDQIILHVSHSEMLISSEVARQIDRFLRTGQFIHRGR